MSDQSQEQSNQSEKQDKFESLLGRLQFSIANGSHLNAHKDIIKDLCALDHPDTLKCLQAYDEKTLTVSHEHVAMWKLASHYSDEGRNFRTQALEKLNAAVSSVGTPSERADMWRWVASDKDKEVRTQALEKLNAAVLSMETPLERAEKWRSIFGRSVEDSYEDEDVRTQVLEGYVAAIPSIAISQQDSAEIPSIVISQRDRAEMWQWAVNKSDKGSDIQKKALKGYAAEIPYFEAPWDRVKMWKWLESQGDNGGEISTLAVAGYIAEIPSFVPSQQADKWPWVYNRTYQDRQTGSMATQAVDNCAAAIEFLKTPEDRAEMWLRVAEYSSKDNKISKAQAVENYAAEIPSIKSPEDRAEMWEWASDYSELVPGLQARAVEGIQEAEDEIELKQPPKPPPVSTDEFILSLGV